MDGKKKIVHIVGTGTIGDFLFGLFTDFSRHLEIDELTFHKRTPMMTEKAKVQHLISRGAKLAVDDDKVADFEALGHKVSYTAMEALERASVVIDCTPAGNENKKVYETIKGPKGYLAQGSEFGFGKMYALGINDEALEVGKDRFIQIVSCNPIRDPSTPPRSVPIGIVPQTMKRMTEFMRPCRRGGQIACR